MGQTTAWQKAEISNQEQYTQMYVYCCSISLCDDSRALLVLVSLFNIL